MSRLGQIISRKIDAEGSEIRQRVGGIAECPRCGKEVELFDETDSWTETESKKEPNLKWKHESYGPAAGECCGLLIVDTFEGCECYILDNDSTTSPEVPA